MKVPTFNFLIRIGATRLWELWRDLTWCRRDKKEWLSKMDRLYTLNPARTISRARLLVGGQPWDWDDNIPKQWGAEFLRRHP